MRPVQKLLSLKIQGNKSKPGFKITKISVQCLPEKKSFKLGDSLRIPLEPLVGLKSLT